MHASPSDPSVGVLPRHVQRATALAGAAILYPGSDPLYAPLAEALAQAVHKRCGARPACIRDTDVMPERRTPLPEALRRQTLFILGDLNSNRAVLRLYADYLCAADASYPGEGGYDLRTIVNPHGTGANVILAGGGSAADVGKGVARLLEILSAGNGGELPFLLEVRLNPAVAQALATWPQTPLDDTDEMKANRGRGLMFHTEMIRAVGSYSMMWWWTGDERYAAVARENLVKLNSQVKDGYGDWHYLADRFLRAAPVLFSGGLIPDEEIARTDRLLLHTALSNQNEWWRMSRDTPPFGHRHQGKGTYEFLLLALYLRDQANPTPALRAQCERWIGECRTYLDALARARIDDQDDESTLNNLASLFRYALGQERHAFFTDGSARLVAERCIALHDNNGAGAGQGGYAEGLPSAMYIQQEATIQVGASAFYYGDGGLKWILETMPNLAVPQRYSFLSFAPTCMQRFDTGGSLKAVRPERFFGIQVLPVTDHQQLINVSPPVNVEHQGHMVNALETWEMSEGITTSRLPQERGFDKISFRAGFGRGDSYLFLQGYQGGFRWQGHMQAANCIVRFFQAGHVFLVQNTWRHSHVDKNGIFVSDGRNDTPMPPIAECVAAEDFPALGMTVTRLPDFHRSTWTRHIFWDKPAEGCFVVLDRVQFEADGPYSVMCTWRTPGYAEIQGRQWVAEQGGHRFTLVSGAELPMTCEEELDQGGNVPFVLRQRQSGTFGKGGEISFQNAFRVRPVASAGSFDLRRIDQHGAVLVSDGKPSAWCAAGVGPVTRWLKGAAAEAESVWASPALLACAGATALSLEQPGLAVTSDRPIGLLLDLATGVLTLSPGSPGSSGAKVSVAAGDRRQEITLSGRTEIPLGAGATATLSIEFRSWLGVIAAPWAPHLASGAVIPEGGWTSDWTYDGGTHLKERIRNLRVSSDPLPVDGNPDQLVDTVLPELREQWTQWPQATRYRIGIELPAAAAVATVRILGDCVDDPTLRSFCPLPEPIQVEAERPDGTVQSCAVAPAAEHRYKRYRDAENRVQARSAEVGGPVRALRVTFPGPTGRPFVLHEIEVFGEREVSPAVTHWLAADIDGDGHREIVLFNAANELIALSERGRELWRLQMPVSLTHLSCEQVEASGPPTVCAGLLGGELRLINGDGSLRSAFRITEEVRKCRDILQGWFNAVHSVAVWHRDGKGRAWLVVGGYAIIVFLDPEGRVVGHGFADGPWCNDILVAKEGGPSAGDLFVRVGWNHGIMQYAGAPGTHPSGAHLNFGGFLQPMFRRLRRITPFVNGRSVAFEWAQVPSRPGGTILAAAELGVGLFSVAEGDWAWKREGGMSLTSCVRGEVGGRPAVVYGGADGFVIAADLENGKVLRSVQVGAPIVGIAPAGSEGAFTVATKAGLSVLDAAWSLRSACPRPLRRMLGMGKGRVAVLRSDNSVERIDLMGGK
jgi:hypothetical protein